MRELGAPGDLYIAPWTVGALEKRRLDMNVWRARCHCKVSRSGTMATRVFAGSAGALESLLRRSCSSTRVMDGRSASRISVTMPDCSAGVVAGLTGGTTDAHSHRASIRARRSTSCRYQRRARKGRRAGPVGLLLGQPLAEQLEHPVGVPLATELRVREDAGDAMGPDVAHPAVAAADEGALAERLARGEDGALGLGRGAVGEDPLRDAAVAGERDGEEVLLAVEVGLQGVRRAPGGVGVRPGADLLVGAGVGEDEGGRGDARQGGHGCGGLRRLC